MSSHRLYITYLGKIILSPRINNIIIKETSTKREQAFYSGVRSIYSDLRACYVGQSHLNASFPSKNVNDVPPKTQIVHGVYSSMSTVFLRTHGNGYITY